MMIVKTLIQLHQFSNLWVSALAQALCWVLGFQKGCREEFSFSSKVRHVKQALQSPGWQQRGTRLVRKGRWPPLTFRNRKVMPSELASTWTRRKGAVSADTWMLKNTVWCDWKIQSLVCFSRTFIEKSLLLFSFGCAIQWKLLQTLPSSNNLRDERGSCSYKCLWPETPATWWTWSLNQGWCQGTTRALMWDFRWVSWGHDRAQAVKAEAIWWLQACRWTQLFAGTLLSWETTPWRVGTGQLLPEPPLLWQWIRPFRPSCFIQTCQRQVPSPLLPNHSCNFESYLYFQTSQYSAINRAHKICCLE